MASVSCQIIVDGIQKIYPLALIKENGGYFVENPRKDIPHQPAMIQLDPKRLLNVDDELDTWSYTA